MRFLFLIFTALFIDSCITIKESSVNQDRFLGSKINSPDIYDKESNGSLFCPINLSMQPMDKLIAIAFKGNSDYNQIELQFFNDKSNGKGLVVMLTKKSDNDIDIYYSKGLHFNNEMYSFDILHKPIETNIDYGFNIANKGVYCELKMTDKKGDVIQLSVVQSAQKLDWTSFLAPVAPQSSNPSFFPFYYMRNTVFCKSTETKIDLLINNKKQTPKRVPLLINKRIVYLTRYAELPIIGMWHTNKIDSIRPINSDTAKLIKYGLINNGRHSEIKSIACFMDNKHNMTLHFSPLIPDMCCLKSDIAIDGKFTISCDSINGIIGGEYKILKSNNKITFTCHPTKGFQPNPGKTWVKTLTWQAECTYKDHDNIMVINSKWGKK